VLRGHTVLLAALFAGFNYRHEHSGAMTWIRCQRMHFGTMFLLATLRTVIKSSSALISEIWG
jgi:hypothetical protein